MDLNLLFFSTVFIALSMNDPDGTMLNLQKVFQAVSERKIDFQVWAATKIVLDRWNE